MNQRVFTIAQKGLITTAILIGLLAVLKTFPALSFEASQPTQIPSRPVPGGGAESQNTSSALSDNKLYFPLISSPLTVTLNSAWVDNPDGSSKNYFLPGAMVRYNLSGSANSNVSVDLRWTLDGPCGVTTIFNSTINLASGAWSHSTNVPAPNCPGYHIATAKMTVGNETKQLDALLMINPPSEVINMAFPRQGFDLCNYPTVEQMQTWWTSSPYWVYNIYVGGGAFACRNNMPDVNWVNQVSQQGWAFILTWVGPQAPCSVFSLKMSSNSATAYQQGRTEASAAFDAARGMGFLGNMVLYYDMEGYGSTASSSCRNAVDAFMLGWTERLHELGVKAGGYGSPASSHIADWANNSPVLDDVWIAHWVFYCKDSSDKYYFCYNPDATVWSSYLSNTLWANHQRLRQYTGGHKETWGGVSLVMDSNALDGEVTTIPGLIPTGAGSAAGAVQLSTTPQIQDMQLISPQSGWVLREGRLLSTNDTGSSWRDLTPTDGQAGPLLAAEFLDEQQGWLVRQAPEPEQPNIIEVLRTRDGGASWESFIVPLAGGLSDQPIAEAYLDFSNPDTGFLALKLQSGSSFSLGRLFATIDGGQTWEERSLPLGEPVAFLDAEQGWTAGGPAGDQLYRTLDGGHTWQQQELDLPVELDPEQVMIDLPQFDAHGASYLSVTIATSETTSLLVYRIEAQGDRWLLEKRFDTDPTYMPGTTLPFSLAPDGKWWAGTGEALLTSALDQANLQVVKSTSLPPGVMAIEMEASHSGWALVQEGNCFGEKTPVGQSSASSGQPFRCEQSMRLLASSDGGQSWREIVFPEGY